LIDFDRVTITYDGADRPVLRDVTLHIPEGELCLVVGPTGAGKSTLLGAVNGLVPHFTGGTLAGSVTVAGRSTRRHPPRELADLVGVVGQDPPRGVASHVWTVGGPSKPVVCASTTSPIWPSRTMSCMRSTATP